MDSPTSALWHPFTPMRSFPRQRRTIASARGHMVTDQRGRTFLDATSGIWNVPLGYGVASIHEAMVRQAATLPAAPLDGTIHEGAERLASRLVGLFPPGFAKVVFATDGSEAVEVAIKLARQAQAARCGMDRNIVIGCTHSYHGVSLGALSVSGIPKDREPFEPLMPGFDHFPAPYCYRCPLSRKPVDCGCACARLLEERILAHGPGRVAAVVLEPVCGYGGVLVPPREYLREIRSICDRHEVLLVLDEVTTGFGRTGTDFAFQGSGVVPDLVTLGKGISAGYAPLSAVVVGTSVLDALGRSGRAFLDHAGDHAGHPVCVAAGNAFLDHLAEHGTVAASRPAAAHLARRLEELRRYRIVGDIRTAGMMGAVELVEDRCSRESLNPQSLSLLLRGLFASPVWLQVYAGGNVIIVSPALNFSDAETDQAVDCLHRALALVEEHWQKRGERRVQDARAQEH